MRPKEHRAHQQRGRGTWERPTVGKVKDNYGNQFMMINNDTIIDSRIMIPLAHYINQNSQSFYHWIHLRSKIKYIALLPMVEITKPLIFMITNVIYVFVQCSYIYERIFSSPGRILQNRRIGNGETKKKLREEQRRRKRKRNPGGKMVATQLSQGRTGVGKKARTCWSLLTIVTLTWAARSTFWLSLFHPRCTFLPGSIVGRSRQRYGPWRWIDRSPSSGLFHQSDIVILQPSFLVDTYVKLEHIVKLSGWRRFRGGDIERKCCWQGGG